MERLFFIKMTSFFSYFTSHWLYFTTTALIVKSVIFLWFSRSTEEVIALFISIAFVVDAVKGTVKSKFLTHMADVCLLCSYSSTWGLFTSLFSQGHVAFAVASSRYIAGTFWLCKSRACSQLWVIRNSDNCSIIPAVRSTTSPLV